VKRRFRLTSSIDFKRVRRHGRSIAHPLVVLISLENNLDRNRIGVAAARAVGNAINRNRAKRLLRAAIAPLLPELPKGYDLVLIARKPILDEKSHTVQKVIENSLKRANLQTYGN
jgi:ribonuclease P protein component